MKFIQSLISFVFIIFLSLYTHAEVYKWTDAEGNVYFGDKPADSNAEKLNIPTKPADKSDDSFERKQKQKKLLDVFADEAADKKTAKEKELAEKKYKKEKCAELQKDIDYLAQGGVFYTKTEDGEYDFKSDEVVGKRLNEYRELYNKHCN